MCFLPAVCRRHGERQALGLPQPLLLSFVEAALDCYPTDLPRHNAAHAAHAAHMAWWLLRASTAPASASMPAASAPAMPPLCQLGLMLAALLADAAHPGVDGGFLDAVDDPIALRHAACEHPVEAHHCAVAAGLLARPLQAARCGSGDEPWQPGDADGWSGGGGNGGSGPGASKGLLQSLPRPQQLLVRQVRACAYSYACVWHGGPSTRWRWVLIRGCIV